MASQIRERAAVVQTSGLLQFAKHGDKTERVKTSFRHHAIPNSIGFALHVTRKVQLRLCGHGLPAHNHGLRALCTFAGSQHAQNHGPNEPGRHARLIAHGSGDVSLCDMTQFMGHDGSQLIACGDDTDQP